MVFLSSLLVLGPIDRAIQVDPYRREVHELRARLASLQNDTAAAVVENEVIVTLEVDDPVEARTNLAEAYLNNGDTALAKRNVLSALEPAAFSICKAAI